MSWAEISLAAQASSARVARRFVRSTLEQWSLGSLSANAELMVSELVTNVVLHARTDLVVRLGLRSTATVTLLRVGVHDGSRRPPRTMRYSDLAATGRGMRIVRALASDSGVQTEADGKTVWFELVVPTGAGTVSAP
ncbi:MAG: ATP-binding protein [Rhodoferax sp.]|nr:ATP-binding protein [Actinomycetota bacterium]